MTRNRKAYGAMLVAASVVVSGAGIVSAAQGEGSTQMPSTASPGAAQYMTHCAACHGETLDGFDHAPPLRGAGFMSGWIGQKQRKLYSRIISTMPANDPGSLEPADVLAITGFILKANNVRTAPAASADDLNEQLIATP